MWNFKAHFRGGNLLKKIMVTKDLSSRRKLRKVFKKKFIEKKGFYDQKYQKNWKSKNGVKTALTPLFKELWAFFGFVKFKNQISPPTKNEKILRICYFSIENLAIFSPFWGQKYNSKSINFPSFGRDFGRILDISTLLYRWILLFIFDFFPKKQIFKSKSSKKLKVQKWCQNGSNSII